MFLVFIVVGNSDSSLQLQRLPVDDNGKNTSGNKILLTPPTFDRYMVSGFVFYYAFELTCSAVMFILVRLAVHYDSTNLATL